MKTVSELSPGSRYSVSMSGKLRDGQRFDGEAAIRLTGWRGAHGLELKGPEYKSRNGKRGQEIPGMKKYRDNWWNLGSGPKQEGL